VSTSEWFLLFLRVAHALAAAVWLGGGVYYLVAIRPVVRATDAPPREFVGAAQKLYGEWARTATLVMIATGVVMSFDRLGNGSGGITYAALLAAKVAAAIAAFWLAGVRPGRRAVRRKGVVRSTPELILSLGLFAFVIGVILASVYGRAPA
jgi:uncharacterized membrane protein